jgi:hypothetical protein
VEDCWPSPSAELQYIAGLHADETVLSLAEELGMPLSAETVEGAAAPGRVTVLEYLVEERHCSLPRDVESSASYSGNIDVLKYLVKRGCEFSWAAYSGAASFGHLPALQYILSTLECFCGQQPEEPDERCGLCEWIANSSIYDAARGGNIEMMQWLQ